MSDINNKNKKDINKSEIKNKNEQNNRVPKRTFPRRFINKRVNNRFAKNRRNQNVIKVNRPKNVIQRNFNRNSKNSIVRGKDLIVSTNNSLVNQTSGIYAIIPINPLYWQGTRIKNMALQYQYYLPKNLSVEYVPTVSKFQPGTITIGCISNQIINQSAIQQTLISSTSGETFSCSEYFRKTIALNSLLPQKKLLLSASINKESVPFYIVILLSGVLSEGLLIAPGSIYFNYNFEFYNPITETLFYKTDNSIQLRDTDFDQQNITAILLEQNKQYGVGTIIDIEIKDQTPIYKYNNSEVELDVDKYVSAFYSSPPGQVKPSVKSIFDLTNFNFANSSLTISLQQGEGLITVNVPQNICDIYYNNTNQATFNISQGLYYLEGQSQDIVDNMQGASLKVQLLGTMSGTIRYTYDMVDVQFVNEH